MRVYNILYYKMSRVSSCRADGDHPGEEFRNRYSLYASSTPPNVNSVLSRKVQTSFLQFRAKMGFRIKYVQRISKSASSDRRREFSPLPSRHLISKFKQRIKRWMIPLSLGMYVRHHILLREEILSTRAHARARVCVYLSKGRRIRIFSESNL